MKLSLPSISFFKVGEFYNSLAAVIIGNLIFIVYRFFEVETLLTRRLADAQMDAWKIFFASKFGAVVVIFTMLLIAVNRDRFKKPLMAELLGFFITLFINLWFWQVWIYKDLPDLLFKVLFSLVTSFFDVAFAHLFIKKWEQEQRRSNAKQSLSALEQQVREYKAKVSDISATVSEKQSELEALNLKVKRIEANIEARTCPKCKVEFSSVNAKNGHMKGCKA